MNDEHREVVLEDGTVTLRPFRASDVDVYVREQDRVMAEGFEWDGPATMEVVSAACVRWTESWRVEGPERNFAIVDFRSGEVVGDCEVEAREDGYVNVMYAVFASWRGRGLATRTAQLLVAYATHEFPDHTPLFRVHPTNVASLAVARRCGATPEGEEVSTRGHVLTRLVVRRHSTPSSA